MISVLQIEKKARERINRIRQVAILKNWIKEHESKESIEFSNSLVKWKEYDCYLDYVHRND